MPEVTDAGDGAPTALIQNLTGGELQDQNEVFISSCKSYGETSFQTGIYAIIRFIQGRLLAGMHKHTVPVLG